MKAALLALLGAAILFLIVVIVLNRAHGAPEVFYGAVAGPTSSDPPDPIAYGLIPGEVKHSCPTCGDCVHPVEILNNRWTLFMTARHRWWQLFNAADRFTFFDEPVDFAGNYLNPAAQNPTGQWEITALLRPAKHEGSTPHGCGTIASMFTARYRLVAGEAPVEERRSAFAAPAEVVDRKQALIYRYENPSKTKTVVLHFAWEIPSADWATHVWPSPCACGKP